MEQPPSPLQWIAMTEGKSALRVPYWQSVGLEMTYVMSSHNSLDGPSPMAPHKHRGPESAVFPCAWHLVNSINEYLWPLPTPRLYHSLVLIELWVFISTFHSD